MIEGNLFPSTTFCATKPAFKLKMTRCFLICLLNTLTNKGTIDNDEFQLLSWLVLTPDDRKILKQYLAKKERKKGGEKRTIITTTTITPSIGYNRMIID